MIANISDLVVSTPVSFNYPLEETPNILVKLGVKASGGVGPDGDIVAFSVVCQHLGCITAFLPTGTGPACDNSYKAPGPEGYCCCHGSIYDLVNGAAVIGGPAPRPVPQVMLSIDSSGDIYAIGMGPPTIFGHDTGSSNVLEDLQGGTLVSGQ
jgi:arsenite oxidase small subunit